MNLPDSFSLHFSGSPWLLLLFVAITALFVLFNYRYTLPAISRGKKWFLISLRTVAFIMLLIAVFEPILALGFNKLNYPKHYLFIDRSRSMGIKDRGGDRNEILIRETGKFLNSSSIANKTTTYIFGSKVLQKSGDSLFSTSLQAATDFQSVFAGIEKEQDFPSAITIVSDGVMNSGANPVSLAERLGIPVFTVTIGDSTKEKDIQLQSLFVNETLEPGRPAAVAVTVSGTGYPNTQAVISLFEEDKKIEERFVTLDPGSNSTQYFTYTPVNEGEKKLTATISPLPGEKNQGNNKNIAFTRVIQNKTKVVILSGTPSPDLALIKSILAEDTTLRITTYTQIGPNKPLETNFREQSLDSAKALILLNFPTQETAPGLANKIATLIRDNNTPFFLAAGSKITASFLKQAEAVLPVNIRQAGLENLYFQCWPATAASTHPIMKAFQSVSLNDFWDNIPPLRYSSFDFTLKPESEVLLSGKLNTTKLEKPVLVTRKFSVSRSVFLAGEGFWKWRLNSSQNKTELIEEMLLRSVKWLVAGNDKKQFSVKPVKKTFASGEKVELIAELFDDSYNPLSDARVTATISRAKQQEQLVFTSLGNGIYTAQYSPSSAGDYFLTASAEGPGIKLLKDNMRFNVGELDVEMFSTVADDNFLSVLSKNTGGQHAYNNADSILNSLQGILNMKPKEVAVASEHALWSHPFFLSIMILLLALEWFFRKRFGML